MALTVENGTGLSTANAYVSVADADAYFTLRGNTDWVDLDTEVKEAAIVRATFGLDSKYRGLWKGFKKTSVQSLAWPRTEVLGGTTGIYDEEGYEVSTTALPIRLVYACAEVASIELTTSYVPTLQSRDDMISSEKIGPISTSYMASAPSSKSYPHVDSLLQGLASSAGNGVGMVISLTAEEISQDDSFDPWDYPSYFNLIKA